MLSRQRVCDVTLELDSRTNALVKIRVGANTRSSAAALASPMYRHEHPDGPDVVSVSKVAYVPYAERHVETHG